MSSSGIHTTLAEALAKAPPVAAPQPAPVLGTQYQVGEIVLMQWQGRTCAYRVMAVREGEGASEGYREFVYTMKPVDTEGFEPQWLDIGDE